jgi:hypothetical protein
MYIFNHSRRNLTHTKLLYFSYYINIAYYENNIVVFTVNTHIFLQYLSSGALSRIVSSIKYLLPWITIEGVDMSKTLINASYSKYL